MYPTKLHPAFLFLSSNHAHNPAVYQPHIQALLVLHGPLWIARQLNLLHLKHYRRSRDGYLPLADTPFTSANKQILLDILRTLLITERDDISQTLLQIELELTEQNHKFPLSHHHSD